MRLKGKDLLGLAEMDTGEIELILDTAKQMKEIISRPIKKFPTLRGHTVVNVFYEPSTRTRVSFELAAKYLGADCIHISAPASSVVKGESLRDTAKTIEALGADVIVLRHPLSGAARMLAKNVHAKTINAGDGAHEHPTQALLDLFTVREKKGVLKGLKVVIIGDILHSRVARSNIWGFFKMGAKVAVCGPATMIPPQIEQMGACVHYQIEEALSEADVVMALRLQLERQKAAFLPDLREYSRLYCLNRQRMSLARSEVLVMHPGPVNRGIEIDDEVLAHSRSVVNEQVTNGVAVRMAALYLLTGEENV